MRSVLEIADISRNRNTWLTRQERIKREGSEYYSWNFPATAAGVICSIEIAKQFPLAKKYEPLDWIEVANNDTVDVSLIMNNSDSLLIHAGTIRTVENRALWQISIKNEDATTSTTLGKIKVSLRRLPLTIDRWAQGRR